MENNNKQNKIGFKLLKIILIILVIVLIFGTAVFSAYLVKAKGNVVDAAIDIATEVVGEQDPIFCLILGISDDISIELTDSIILVGYNPNIQKAFMISIPRDTYIGKNYKNANGNDKINSLYQKNPQKIIDSVENITGIKIDNYIAIKNDVLVKLVDTVGGIDFNVPINMNYDDPTQNLHIHIDAGLQHLNGNQAEGLVRFRHNNNGTTYPADYGDNDYGRMRTQRDFIKALGLQIIRINNIANIKEIASAIFDNIETDLELSKILSYIPYGLKFDINDLKSEQLPGESEQINNLWFYRYNSEKTKVLLDKMLNELEICE